ncbi:hypothetical protein BV22DRAFT_1191322 [Leucogyrophana mollusca]|uniref:Uncharacterized protein n=1 Tax=Leucogyrophana mollusca TaxID=85980 RepID=A0ACB8BXW6_9AGAM|nr:hypothetical protein BV22DRAFT_1191322 [Leucogyrophana mollusca]
MSLGYINPLSASLSPRNPLELESAPPRHLYSTSIYFVSDMSSFKFKSIPFVKNALITEASLAVDSDLGAIPVVNDLPSDWSTPLVKKSFLSKFRGLKKDAAFKVGNVNLADLSYPASASSSPPQDFVCCVTRLDANVDKAHVKKCSSVSSIGQRVKKLVKATCRKKKEVVEMVAGKEVESVPYRHPVSQFDLSLSSVDADEELELNTTITSTPATDITARSPGLPLSPPGPLRKVLKYESPRVPAKCAPSEQGSATSGADSPTPTMADKYDFVFSFTVPKVFEDSEWSSPNASPGVFGATYDSADPLDQSYSSDSSSMASFPPPFYLITSPRSRLFDDCTHPPTPSPPPVPQKRKGIAAYIFTPKHIYTRIIDAHSFNPASTTSASTKTPVWSCAKIARSKEKLATRKSTRQILRDYFTKRTLRMVEARFAEREARFSWPSDGDSTCFAVSIILPCSEVVQATAL